MPKVQKSTWKPSRPDVMPEGRKFESGQVVSLAEGDIIIGTFQGRSTVFLPQKVAAGEQSKPPKECPVYAFKDIKTGEPFVVLGGRTILDKQMDEAANALDGYENMRGSDIIIERLGSTRTSSGSELGRWTVTLVE